MSISQYGLFAPFLRNCSGAEPLCRRTYFVNNRPSCTRVFPVLAAWMMRISPLACGSVEMTEEVSHF